MPRRPLRFALRCLGTTVLTLCIFALANRARATKACVGDCDDNGAVAIDELVAGVALSAGGQPADACVAFDGNADGSVTVEELLEGVRNALRGCPLDPAATATAMSTATTPSSASVTPTASGTPPQKSSQTPTPTAAHTRPSTPMPTSTPAPATLVVRVHNPTGTEAVLELSGERLSGPAEAAGEPAYGPLSTLVAAAGAGAAVVPIPSGLAPGIWVHRLRRLGVVEYAQHQQSLVIADPEAPNTVEWEVFRTVLTVNRSGDDGDGTCGASCTLRDAVDTANVSPAPVLIRFNADRLADAEGRVRIRIDRTTPLRIRAPGLVLDGRDAAGNPSPLADFGERVYPTTIVLIAANADPEPAQPCPCREASGGAIRVQAPGVRLEGLAIERQLPPEGEICCGDQDLVAFDAGSKNSQVRTCLLDGGARAISSAQVTQGETHAPTGKDCIDATNTGATAEEPVVVENSEVRYCLDRGVKSETGYVQLKGNWIHHNLRGGVLVLSPPPGAREKGVVEAVANLIEANGRNCPTGDPRDCGPAQHVTRARASEIALQGNLTLLRTAGNVLRDGVLNGMFFQGRSEGEIEGDYVCGIADGSGAGIGILVKMNKPAPPVPCLSEDDCESDGACIDGQCVDDTQGAPAVTVRGVTAAYNGDSGVRLNGYRSADFGTAGGAKRAGNNAFTHNGFTAGGAARLKRNFVNALADSTAIVPARGNQWQHCYAAKSVSSDQCSPLAISRNDTNNANASRQADRVDPGEPQPHASTGSVQIDAIAPSATVQGGLVHIRGSGFDAISGHATGSRDCGALAAGNRCDVLQGTCVEFFAGGRWVPADDVLSVTPTHIVVRSPLTCAEPTLVRVRRAVLGGGEVISEPAPFCRN